MGYLTVGGHKGSPDNEKTEKGKYFWFYFLSFLLFLEKSSIVVPLEASNNHSFETNQGGKSLFGQTAHSSSSK